MALLSTSSRSSVDRAPAWCSEGPAWVQFLSGTQIYSLSHARVMFINSPFTWRLLFIYTEQGWRTCKKEVTVNRSRQLFGVNYYYALSSRIGVSFLNYETCCFFIYTSMFFYKIITEFLDLSSATTLRHEHSFDKMILNPGLTAYAVRLEDRL